MQGVFCLQLFPAVGAKAVAPLLFFLMVIFATGYHFCVRVNFFPALDAVANFRIFMVALSIHFPTSLSNGIFTKLHYLQFVNIVLDGFGNIIKI